VRIGEEMTTCEPFGDARSHLDPSRPVHRLESHAHAHIGLVHLELRAMVLAGIHPASENDVDPGIAISPRDVDTTPWAFDGVPLNGKAMGRILATQSSPAGGAMGSHLTESNEADARHPLAADKLRTERLWEETRHHVRIHAIVHEQPTLDPPLKPW
jgi:hypothetical protein